MAGIRGIVALLAAGLGAIAAAQPAPSAPEVFVAAFAKGGTGLEAAVNASQNPGYDGQPAFLGNSRQLLFASNRDGKQTDIYRYDVKSRGLSRLTRTDDSEYSPQPLPDGKGFSTVRVEPAGVERLWIFPDRGKPGPAFETATRVRSYAWIDKTHVALAVLDARGAATMSLELGDLTAGTRVPLAPNVGRSVARRPDRDAITFVRPGTSAVAGTIKNVDLKTREITDLTPTVKGSEDAAWTPSGDLLMARGGTIYRWTKTHPVWTTFADEPATLCTNITRLAVSPDGKWLAFVADPVSKPARGR